MTFQKMPSFERARLVELNAINQDVALASRAAVD